MTADHADQSAPLRGAAQLNADKKALARDPFEVLVRAVDALDAEEQTAMHDALHQVLTTVAASGARRRFGVCRDCNVPRWRDVRCTSASTNQSAPECLLFGVRICDIVRTSWLHFLRTAVLALPKAKLIGVTAVTPNSQRPASALPSSRITRAERKDNGMAKNTICLWYDKDAEAAARYAATFPDSAVGAVHRAPSDYPSGKEGVDSDAKCNALHRLVSRANSSAKKRSRFKSPASTGL